MCFICAVGFGIWEILNQDVSKGMQASGFSLPIGSILIFLSYLVLLNTMIPISLIVSIEIVKVSQSYFINKDTLMYSQYRKKKADVKTASLNEELGQIEYIFTDKTGTLTMNLMEFKIAIIGQKMYGDRSLIYNS
jgi:P-type E1-E2 ATPase